MRFTSLLVLSSLVTLTSGCFAHHARGYSDAVHKVSDAKDREHLVTHEIDRDESIVSKKEDLIDLFTACIAEHDGAVAPCNGYRIALREYGVSVDDAYYHGGMDPAVKARLYIHAAEGVHVDQRQDFTLNRLGERTGVLEDRADQSDRMNAAQWSEMYRIEDESLWRDNDIYFSLKEMKKKVIAKFGTLDSLDAQAMLYNLQLKKRIRELETARKRGATKGGVK